MTARLHVTELGSGPPVLLVPGWPQSGYAWRFVAPELARTRRVVIAEPRGLGESEQTPGDTTIAAAADDIAALVDELGGPLDVVAHDVGSWVTHALAVTRPELVRSLVLVDAGIPGVTTLPSGIPDAAGNIRSWHFAFNRLPDLPELLIEGREREYLAWLFHSKSVQHEVFDDAALDEYTRILAAPGALAAGLAYYRENLGAGGLDAARARGALRLPMPVLAVGASWGVGATLFEGLRERADRLDGVVFEDCGHYVPEEQPERLVAAIEEFWAGVS